MLGKSLAPTLTFCLVLAYSLVVARVASAEESSATLERVDIPLVAWIAQQDRARPDSIADMETLVGEKVVDFREMIRAMVAKDFAVASAAARRIAYELVVIENNIASYVVANDNSRTGQHPTIVINTTPTLDAIVGAPHAAFETGTAEQAALLVTLAGARAAIVAGAHRCASQSYVSCDGKTRVCGTLESYRTSDVAHNPNTLFHEAHILLATAWPNSVVLSLHGMREDTDGAKTSIIVSHGYKSEDVIRISPATRFRFALAERFGEEGEVVSCDLSEDLKYDARRLCGYTNIQGRFVNGDVDVCRDSQTEGTNRFIHIEQDWRILRPFDRSWGSSSKDQTISDFIAATSEALPQVAR